MEQKESLNLFLEANALIERLQKIIDTLNDNMIDNRPSFFFAYTDLLYNLSDQLKRSFEIIHETILRR